jgi:hypothetical protein
MRQHLLKAAPRRAGAEENVLQGKREWCSSDLPRLSIMCGASYARLSPSFESL